MKTHASQKDPLILSILDAHAPKITSQKKNHHLRHINGHWYFELHHANHTYTRRLPTSTESAARRLRDAILADLATLKNPTPPPGQATPAPGKKRGRPKKQHTRKKPTPPPASEPSPLHRPCRLFDTTYATLMDAAQELDIKPETLSRMCSQQKYGWSYAD